MTTREHDTIQRFFNRMSDIDREKDEVLEQLQQISVSEGDGHRWCTIVENLRSVQRKHGIGTFASDRAQRLYVRYEQLCAQEELLMDLGSELAEINFWRRENAELSL